MQTVIFHLCVFLTVTVLWMVVGPMVAVILVFVVFVVAAAVALPIVLARHRGF